jgi:hypothetical protein
MAEKVQSLEKDNDGSLNRGSMHPSADRIKPQKSQIMWSCGIPITKYGVDIMVTKTSSGKITKTSRGMRKHVRRMKQESRKAGIPISELKKKVRSSQVTKVKKEA